MEDTISKPLFVEFYGLPGCGKSTVSHMVSERLSKEGYVVAEPSYEIDHLSSIIRKFKKLLLGINYSFFKQKLYKEVSEIVSKNGYFGTNKFLQTLNIIQKILEYNKKQSKDVIFWDQGLVQAALSLSTQGNIASSDNLNQLYCLLDKSVRVLNVLIDVDENIALKRMLIRPSNNSRVEKLKDKEDKYLMLNRFQLGIDSINKNYSKEVVNGVDDIDNQVTHIYKVISAYLRTHDS